MIARVPQKFGRSVSWSTTCAFRGRRQSRVIDMADFERILSGVFDRFLGTSEAARHFLDRTGGGAILNNLRSTKQFRKSKNLRYSVARGSGEHDAHWRWEHAAVASGYMQWGRAQWRHLFVGRGLTIGKRPATWRATSRSTGSVPGGEIAMMFAIRAADDASYLNLPERSSTLLAG